MPLVPLTESTTDGLDSRVVVLPKCGRPGCECSQHAALYLRWVTAEDEDRWINVGYSIGELEALAEMPYDGLELMLYPRLSLLVGVPWDVLDGKNMGYIGADHVALIEQMPGDIAGEIMARDLDDLEGLGPEMIDALRSVVQESLARHG